MSIITDTGLGSSLMLVAGFVTILWVCRPPNKKPGVVAPGEDNR